RQVRPVLLGAGHRDQDGVLLGEVVADVDVGQLREVPRPELRAERLVALREVRDSAHGRSLPASSWQKTSATWRPKSGSFTCAGTVVIGTSGRRRRRSSSRNAASASGSQNTPPGVLGIDRPRVGTTTCSGPVAAPRRSAKIPAIC